MVRKFFKWTGILVLVIVVFGGSFAAHEWHADKPFMFRSYVDRMLIKVAFEDPETLTSLGFLESMGINGHNAHLDDVHPDRTEEFLAEMMAFGEGLHQYDDEDLDADQRLTKEIVLYLTNLVADAVPFRYHTYPANQMSGIQSGFPSFMDSSHQVHSVEDAENYLSRMSELPRKHEQYLLGLKIRESEGIIPPQFVIDRVLEQMRDFVATPATENILYTSLARKLDEAEDIDETQAAELLARVEVSIDENIYPAEEIHATGLAEVARIQSEMMEIFTAEGADVSQGYTLAMEEYSSRPEFYYEDSDAGRAQILEDYQAMLDEFDANLDSVFNIRPQAGMEVVRIPAFKEKTSPGAYYEPPALDGARPGRFFANLYDIKATPKFGMRTLAVHEGIPGHHFQIAIAMELEGMPFIRRFGPFVAYVEGWALYAERVAWEYGLLPTAADNIGRLAAELFRAVRLVVDTGIHHQRWTREEAIDYMAANTGMAESDVISEIERYIVMPGQATAYKVGMMKILELRQRAMDQLGDQFDIRDFHDVVLKNGAVPLDILERIIDNYIETTLAQ